VTRPSRGALLPREDADRFEQILKRLAAHVGGEAAQPFSREGLELRRVISNAARAYDGVSADATEQSTLHELGAPLARVIELLRDDTNSEQLLVALGAPTPVAPMTWSERDRPEVERVMALHEAIVSGLGKIADAVPPLPARPAHRPSRSKDLRAAVEVLIDYFERKTGQEFRQDWKGKGGGDPLTAGTMFVRDAMQLIAPKRLDELPAVTADIRRARRGQRPPRTKATRRTGTPMQAATFANRLPNVTR
jgi:hypothetical protein